MRSCHGIANNRLPGGADATNVAARPSLFAASRISPQADRLAIGAEAALPGLVFDFAQMQIRPDAAPLLQPKLAIGRSDDPLEREADRVAEQVLRMPEPGAVHRAPGSSAPGTLPTVELLLPNSVGAGASLPSSASPLVHDVVHGPGQSLDSQTRAYFEPRFGHDFSRVRIHSDARAAASARQINALAYTAGNRIVFGDAQFAPATVAGQRLLAHELTHVVQQTHGVPLDIQRQDDEKQKSTPSRDEYVHEMLCGSGGGGLFGRTRVTDVFRFSGTFFTDPADVAAAEIEDLRTGKRDLYYIDSWLDNEWQIVKVELNQVIVVNATCGTEEILGREAAAQAQAKAEGPAPEQTVQASKGTLGQGTVNISNGCKRVEFIPADKSKDVRIYQFDDAISEYVLQTDDEDKKATYPPLLLPQVVGVRLLEYDENGKLHAKNCGIPRGARR